MSEPEPTAADQLDAARVAERALRDENIDEDIERNRRLAEKLADREIGKPEV